MIRKSFERLRKILSMNFRFLPHKHLRTNSRPLNALLIICSGFLSGFILVRMLFKSEEVGPIPVGFTTHMKDPLETTTSILCWVLTSPVSHTTRAQHVKNTWGQRCNTLLFMSSVQDPLLGSVSLPVSEGRDHLWAKTKESLKYLYSNHLYSCDWFLKADDDTYVVLSNLRSLLSKYNASEPLYLGIKFQPKDKPSPIYAGGGSGYVLSRAAVKMVVERGLPFSEKCRQDDGGDEDVELGACLDRIGIGVTDTRDEEGAMRFMPYMPNIHADEETMQEPKKRWFEEFTYFKPYKKGMAGLSSTAISFHYVSPEEMYELDFLINHLRSFGTYNKLHKH